MEIKKGMKFRCIKTVVMKSGETYYIKNGIYMSHYDDCITDIQFDKEHSWKDCNCEKFFVPFNEGYNLKTTEVHCNTQDEFNKILYWHEQQKNTSFSGQSIERFRKNWEICEENTFITLDDGFQYGNVKRIFDEDDILLSFPVFVHDFIETEDYQKNTDANIESIINENTVGSVKNDFKDDKLRWDLLPLDLIEEVVKVYHAGAKKYGANRWQNLEGGFERYRAASLRHIVEYMKGERIDKETKCHHLAAAAWNILAMLYYDKHGKGIN